MISTRSILNHPYFINTKKLLSYGLWTIGAFSLPLLIDRFFISPLLTTRLGEETFGKFLWLISIVYIFVMAINSGYGNTLLREYNTKRQKDSDYLLGSVFYLTLYTSLFVMFVAGVTLYSFNYNPNLLSFYFLLFSYGIAQCLLWVFLTYSRIKRSFKFVFILKTVEALGLLSMTVLVKKYELWIVALFYLFSSLLAISVSVWFYYCREKILPFKWNRVASKKILLTAPSFATSSFIEYTTIYAPRIMLGMMSGNATITFLFIATSTANLFILPISIGSSLLLSLLAGKDKFVDNMRGGLLFLLFIIIISIIVYLLTYFIGIVIINYLYPQLSVQSYVIFKWISIANIFYTINLLIRSVLIKYSSLRIIIMIPTYSIIIMILLLFFLIPVYDATGAAIAILITAGIESLLFIIYYLKYCSNLTPEVQLN